MNYLKRPKAFTARQWTGKEEDFKYIQEELYLFQNSQFKVSEFHELIIDEFEIPYKSIPLGSWVFMIYENDKTVLKVISDFEFKRQYMSVDEFNETYCNKEEDGKDS